MRKLFGNCGGFTLIELVIIIIIMGILAGIAISNFGDSIDIARFESTRHQLEVIGRAITGNPEILDSGTPADFGYIGDIGALPPNLEALAVNPGLGTWNGPYIAEAFTAEDFKKDAWNADLVYSDTLLRSVGSGNNIDYLFAISRAALLNNEISGYIIDADRQLPGAIYKDSVVVNLAFPDGGGGISTSVINPSETGNFSFSGIPIGRHILTVIYIPDTDTMTYSVNVVPNSETKLEIISPHDLW